MIDPTPMAAGPAQGSEPAREASTERYRPPFASGANLEYPRHSSAGPSRPKACGL